jgi:SAM-dependent methyltransferase
VAEHFANPLACNREIARVLKPDGLLLFQTPNRFYYPCVAASLTPHWFHEFYVKHFASGRCQDEVFPTFYRLNDEKVITKQLADCVPSSEIQYRSLPPGYLRFSPLAFRIGILYERTFERLFPSLRGNLIVVARKLPPAGPS